MVRTDTPAESGVERPVEMAAVRWSCRTGTESREMLPLWNINLRNLVSPAGTASVSI